MFSEIIRALGELFDTILVMLGFRGTLSIGENSLRVFVKFGGGVNENNTIQVDLNPSWTVKKVKEIIAPKLGFTPEELRIIFAGNELPDEFVLESCDVGQQSFLHAVRVQLKSRSDDNNDDQGQSSSREENSISLWNYETDIDSETLDIFHSPPGVKSGSHFFVYCNKCESLQEGKLRVRCSTCLSGAFTVSRHPEEWKDVLIPKQVEGICSTMDCTGKYAQFYFKCTAHVTTSEDDSCPPLPQFKRNIAKVSCLACGDAKEIAFVFECPKTHSTCIECFEHFIKSKIQNREFTQDQTIGYTVGCPALCRNSLIKDPHHFKLMGKHDYERYQRFGTEECVLQAGGVLCPQPGCGMGILLATEDPTCNKVACTHGCGYVFCRLCLEGWHLGSCRGDGSLPSTSSSTRSPFAAYSVNLERAAQSQWDDANRRHLRLTTKPCPKCRVPTERAGGCMHMECTKCKFQWCWVCQTQWDRECMGNHWFG